MNKFVIKDNLTIFMSNRVFCQMLYEVFIFCSGISHLKIEHFFFKITDVLSQAILYICI